jgi:fucose permease
MKPVSPKLILALNYLIFLCFGMFLGGIGTVFNELAIQTSSTLTAVGGIITFLFLGSLLAQIVAGPLTDRFGHSNILVTALVILGLGIIGFTFARSLPVMFILVFIAGMGQGGVDIGANLVVSDSAPEDNTSVLNLLHFFFGLGAFIGPALIGIAIASTGSGLLVERLSAGALILLGIAIYILLRDKNSRNMMGSPAVAQKDQGFRIYLSPLLWLLGILMVAYVGLEFGLGSWITNYMHITTGVALQYGALATSAFWGALALGRLAGAAASSRMTRLRLMTIALFSSLAGAVGMLLSQGAVWPSVICIAWISFSFGTVYPTTVAYAIAEFSTEQGKAVGFLVALGNIGGIALPWLAGLLLVSSATLGYLGFILLSILAMLGILLLIQRWNTGRLAKTATAN